MTNKNVYQNKKIVQYYSNSEGLQLPEKSILQIIETNLKNANVLDIGVGGGRTTPFFAPKSNYYLGIDFSKDFIEICKKKYTNLFPHAEFKTVDARSLELMENNFFDIVLFSFNGIDNVNYEERINIIKSIHRILKPNGFFIFSSHNINYLPILSKYKFYKNPFATIKTAFKHYKFLKKNNDSLKKENEYTFIFDDTYDFGLHTCYINSIYQINQLKKNGFYNVKVFSLNNGNIVNDKELKLDSSAWLYYLCQKITSCNIP